jgi:hypothetical protein
MGGGIIGNAAAGAIVGGGGALLTGANSDEALRAALTGGVAAGASSALQGEGMWGAQAAGGTPAAADPLSDYLRTGASDMSTYGGLGGGGAGAVGAGSAASNLQMADLAAMQGTQPAAGEMTMPDWASGGNGYGDLSALDPSNLTGNPLANPGGLDPVSFDPELIFDLPPALYQNNPVPSSIPDQPMGAPQTVDVTAPRQQFPMEPLAEMPPSMPEMPPMLQPAAPSAGPTNAAQIDSYTETPGYGASSSSGSMPGQTPVGGNGLSLGDGGLGLSGNQTSTYDGIIGATGSPGLANAGANVAGGVDALGEFFGPAASWVRQNPQLARLIFSGAGGLLGATQGGAGGGSGGGGGASTFSGEPVQWTGGLQMGIQPGAQQWQPSINNPAAVQPRRSEERRVGKECA